VRITAQTKRGQQWLQDWQRPPENTGAH